MIVKMIKELERMDENKSEVFEKFRQYKQQPKRDEEYNN